jgi:hypothetical protein
MTRMRSSRPPPCFSPQATGERYGNFVCMCTQLFCAEKVYFTMSVAYALYDSISHDSSPISRTERTRTRRTTTTAGASSTATTTSRSPPAWSWTSSTRQAFAIAKNTQFSVAHLPTDAHGRLLRGTGLAPRPRQVHTVPAVFPPVQTQQIPEWTSVEEEPLVIDGNDGTNEFNQLGRTRARAPDQMYQK